VRHLLFISQTHVSANELLRSSDNFGDVTSRLGCPGIFSKVPRAYTQVEIKIFRDFRKILKGQAQLKQERKPSTKSRANVYFNSYFYLYEQILHSTGITRSLSKYTINHVCSRYVSITPTLFYSCSLIRS
jgi:hypothetical protein